MNLKVPGSSDRKNHKLSVNRNVSFLLPLPSSSRRPPPGDPVTTSNPSTLPPGGSDVVVSDHCCIGRPGQRFGRRMLNRRYRLSTPRPRPLPPPPCTHPSAAAVVPVRRVTHIPIPQTHRLHAVQKPPTPSASRNKWLSLHSRKQTYLPRLPRRWMTGCRASLLNLPGPPGPVRYCNLLEAPLSNAGGLDSFDSSSSPLIPSHELDEGLTAALVSPSPDSPTSFARPSL